MTGSPQRYTTQMSWQQLIAALSTDLSALYGGAGGGGFPATPAQGDLVYYNGTAWAALAPGASGQFLETLGAGANPAWATVSSAASAGNVTPDTHAALPTGVGLGPNDEFEAGSVIDTIGGRYTGATAWTAMGLSTGSTAVANGSLIFSPALTASRNFGGYSQPVAGSTFTYTAKLKIYCLNASLGAGIFFATGSGASGKILWLGFTNTQFVAQLLTNNTTFSANEELNGGYLVTYVSPLGTNTSNISPWVYFQLTYDGTNIKAGISDSGLPGSFTTFYSGLASTLLGGAPALVGIGADNESATAQLLLMVDWFRRTA